MHILIFVPQKLMWGSKREYRKFEQCKLKISITGHFNQNPTFNSIFQLAKVVLQQNDNYQQSKCWFVTIFTFWFHKIKTPIGTKIDSQSSTFGWEETKFAILSTKNCKFDVDKLLQAIRIPDSWSKYFSSHIRHMEKYHSIRSVCSHMECIIVSKVRPP